MDKDGLYYLFDFKRVASNHKLDPNEKGFTPGRGLPPACGLGQLAHLADTYYQKHSLQTSVYNLMLHATHGIDVNNRIYLLRMHADRAEYIVRTSSVPRPAARGAHGTAKRARPARSEPACCRFCGLWHGSHGR